MVASQYLRVGLVVSVFCMMCAGLSCTGKNKDAFGIRPTAVVGKVTLTNSSKIIKNVTVQMKILSGDTITTDKNSSTTISFQSFNAVSVGQQSRVAFTGVLSDKKIPGRLEIACLQGALCVRFASTQSFEVPTTIVSALGSVTSSKGTIGIISFPDKLVVIALSGSATLSPKGSSNVTLADCEMATIATGSTPVKQSVGTEGMGLLRVWFSDESLALVAGNVHCIQSSSAAVLVNQPPRFTKMVRTNAVVGKEFVDTLVAVDPQSYPVKYFLVKGPQGCAIQSTSGILSFTPKSAGTFEVQVQATDSANLNVVQSYSIVAIAEGVSSLQAVLVCLSIASLQETVTLDASQSINKPDGIEKLVYRFDTNGDGTFDAPSNGDFGQEPSVKATFSEQAEVVVRVEIKNAAGQISSAKHTISVNAAPTPLVKVNKASGPLETVFAFDASGSTDGKEKADKLKFEWNFGDGSAPVESHDATVSHSFVSSGMFTVTLIAKDRFGSAAKATVNIDVFSHSGIDSLSFPDSSNVNKDIVFKCNPSPATGKIVEYAWDFEGKNSFEKTSAEPTIHFAFAKEGSFTVSCRIRDDKSQTATAQKKIIIANSATVVDARGPYNGRVNAAIKFSGIASDPDNAIVSYEWDFDGNGKMDFTSTKASDATFSFTKSGVFKSVLTVMTDDKKITKAETKTAVSNEVPRAFAGDDIVSTKGHKVTLKGNGRDLEGKVALYEWDFNADGKYDWSSKDTGTTAYQFLVFSTPVLRVTDSDGATATDTLHVVICPQGMELNREGKFCIDQYEFPNKKGQIPSRSNTWQEAQDECKKVGKHLCSALEWTSSCAGIDADVTAYPYGNKFVIENSNTLGNPWSHNTPSKSGAFENCKSKLGVFDMSGNVAEWTSDADKGSAYVYGGSYQSSERESRCDSKVLLDKNKKYFYVGFRCCK